STSSALGVNCPPTALGIYNVCANATGGDGTPSDPWTGWESSLNAQPGAAAAFGGGGMNIYFPAGYYSLATRIDLEPGWILRGAGMRATTITTAAGFNDDAFKSSSPINRATALHIAMEDMGILYNPASPASVGAAVDVIAGAHVKIRRVLAEHFAYGIIFDQVLVSDIEDCDIEGAAIGGIWLVNGNDHYKGTGCVAGACSGKTPPPSTCDCAGYSHRIGIHHCTLNMGTPGAIGIIDDGGAAHVIKDCNFNYGLNQIRIADTQAATISGCYFEGAVSSAIYSTFQSTFKTMLGPNTNLTVSDNSFTCAEGQHCMSLDDGSELLVTGNIFSSNVAAVSGVNQAAYFSAMANFAPPGTPLFDSDPSTAGSISTDTGLGIGTATPTGKLDVKDDHIRWRNAKTPAGSSDPSGNVGDVAWDANYVYVRTGSGWKRSALTTW
ncbi:MAG TPA: right-handed parallel beta-helix repeat-containing protein, partial [Polyangiaceae bacterium]|nr:right-handed parallel beta-helix repeat-containing protein [Polyangiaceae bacterium]